MTTPSDGVDEMLAQHCDEAYERLLALCGTRNSAPRWDDIQTLLRERDRLRASARPGGVSIFTPPDSDVTALSKEYLERRVACMTEAVDREQWRQEDGDARRPEYWVGRLHEAKIALNNLTQGLERRGDSFGNALSSTGERKP